MTGNSELAREWNRLVDYIAGLELRVEPPLELTRTPGQTLLRMKRRGASVIGTSRVVVLESSVAAGPTPFDSLTYAVELIDRDESIPELSGDDTLPIYRICDMVRFGERFDDGDGNQIGWRVDPARPGTFGQALTFPAYDASGSPIPDETRTVVRLFDERVSVRGCEP